MPELYFEDFVPGEVLDFGEKLVTAEEIAAFKAAFDPLPGQAAADGAASAWHCCGILMRLMCDGYLLRTSSLGAPGIDSMIFHRPVRAGDRLTGRRETLDLRRSEKRPDVGIVKSRHQIFDRQGEAVLTMTASAFFRCRGAAS